MVEIIDKKREALQRMKALELLPECIKAFEERNEIWISEINGILFDLSQRPNIVKRINEFEEEHNALVYHCIYTNTEFGTLITIFYVSDHEDEWALDWEDMEEHHALCYVINLEDEQCSEIGDIIYESKNGGLIRIA